MTSPTTPLARDSDAYGRPHEFVTTYAERHALQAREREEQKHLSRAEQSSTLNSPDVRIRAWEKVHGLRLPSDTAHPILEIIAADTGLAISQVREEQQARLARR